MARSKSATLRALCAAFLLLASARATEGEGGARRVAGLRRRPRRATVI